MIALKILFMLTMPVLMAIPIAIEYFRFRKDERTLKVSRFRLVVFTLCYTVAVTLVLLISTRLIEWIKTWGFVRWITSNIGSYRTDYATSLYTVILINIIIGAGFVLLQSFVRIGLSKMNVTVPKNGEFFTRIQEFERKLIGYFNREEWFFVGRLLKYLTIVLSALFGVLFVVFQIPTVFAADWIPYGGILSLFKLSYQYPMIAMLLLWEFSFFLLGIEAFVNQCPNWEGEKQAEAEEEENPLQDVDEDCRKKFGIFYASSMELKAKDSSLSSKHKKISSIIANNVKNDRRNQKSAKDIYARALDKMDSCNGGVLFNGGFFSEFSMYFFRYLSVRLARGDHLIFVCNSDMQSEQVEEYLRRGFSEISSLYYAGRANAEINKDLSHPIWEIVRVGGKEGQPLYKEQNKDGNKNKINGSSILITTPDFLCSNTFEENNSYFVSYLDTVIFVDSVNCINRYEKRLSILNTKLMHIIENSVQNPICARPIRYFFFDETRTPGTDKVLKNMFSTEMETVDIMGSFYRATVSCYNYNIVSEEEAEQEDETEENEYTEESGEYQEEQEDYTVPHFIPTEENLGVMMEMAINAVLNGASTASVFVEEQLPYKAIAESLNSHDGKLGKVALGTNLLINEYFYNPDGYSVIIALDAGNNLPSALRKYISITTDKPALVILFSRPYLFRDYYIANMEKLWQGKQILRIPVAEGTEKDIAQKILVKANSGGITKEELLALAGKIHGLEFYVRNRSINLVLQKILNILGKKCESLLDVYQYFEYTSFRDFDRSGDYSPQTKISLRSKHLLYDIIRLQDRILLHTENQGTVELPLPKKRLTQNYIEGQNLLFEGEIYYINKLDNKKGEIFAKLANSGYNSEVYSYIQNRTYRLDCSPEKIEYLYSPKTAVISQKNRKNKVNTPLTEVYVTAFKATAEVRTDGYYDLDPQSMDRTAPGDYHPISSKNDRILAAQTYRCYGAFKDENSFKAKLEAEKAEEGMENSFRFFGKRRLSDIPLNIYAEGLSVLSVRLEGEFGESRAKIASLAAVMLDEILRAKFPSVADSTAVCPVNGSKDDITTLPKVEFIKEYGSEKAVEILIIEDCAEDLGVISSLMTSGGDVLRTLFEPIKEYLDWYMSKKNPKGDYLWFGMDSEPECFDFSALHGIAKVLGDVTYKLQYVDAEEISEYHVCDFCGKRYMGTKHIAIVDDRIICHDCAKELIGNNQDTLKQYLSAAKQFMEERYKIKMDDTYEFCYESTVKIIDAIRKLDDIRVRNTDITAKSYIRGKQVHAEYNLPGANLSELFARELTHIWQIRKLPRLPEDIAKGHVAWVGIEYLDYLNHTDLAEKRTLYYESAESEAAEGYRKLKDDLQKNKQFNNNPFRYLLGGDDPEEEITDNENTDNENTDNENTGNENTGNENIGNENIGNENIDDEPEEESTPSLESAEEKAEKKEEKDTSSKKLSYFYYDRLSEPLRNAYDRALEAILAHKDTFQADVLSDPDVIKKVLRCITYDHPEIFWFSLNNTFRYTTEGSVTIRYCISKEEADALNRKMKPEIDKYLEGITDTMSEYDKALYLYISLINCVDYDGIALIKERKNGGPESGEIDNLRNICGVFLSEKTVCEGYARAYQYLVQQCGIECAECTGVTKPDEETGDPGEPHAWNILKLDGDYYHLDATWDDRSNTLQKEKRRDIGYNYFCITTEEILRTRNIDVPVDVPECKATKCNYYYHNQLVLESCDLERVKAIVTSAVRKGERFCTFKCKSYDLLNELYDKILKPATQKENVVEEVYKRHPDENIEIKVLKNKEIFTITVYMP